MWCIGPVVSESLCVYDVCGESTELCGKYVGLVEGCSSRHEMALSCVDTR